MAFNPFTWFRKHQKVFFAGLTIVCMITFVASFGAGDVIHRGLEFFGATRQRGDVVTTLYGSKVTEGELQRLSDLRLRASNLMIEFCLTNHFKVADDLVKKELKGSALSNPLAELGKIVEDYQQRQRTAMQFARAPQLIGQFLGPQAQQAVEQLGNLVHDREKIKNDPEALAVAERVAALLAFQAWEFRPNRDELYFGGGRRTNDLLDFLVWRHQADRLGMVLTDADVMKEISKAAAVEDAFEGKKFDANPRVLAALGERRDRRQRATLRPQDLLNALRDEFRVSMAQGILLGFEPGVRSARSQLGLIQPPAYITPDEFFNYYRRQRTTVRVKMLPIPVEKFLGAVKGSPTEQELLNRYERWKDQEPRPDRRDPGFKEPRRIQVEYVSASPADPYYRAEGLEIAQALEKLSQPQTRAVAQLTAGATLGKFGAGPIGCAAVVVPLALDPVGLEYAAAMKEHHSWLNSPDEDRTELEKKLHDVSVWRPANVASTLGELFAAGAGRGSAFSAPATLYATGTVAEARDSIRFTAAVLAAGANASAMLPAVPALTGSAALALPFLPGYRTREQMQSQLAGRLAEHAAEELLRHNLDTVRTELGKLRGRKKEAAAYAQKAVKEYHLKYDSMPEPMSQADLLDALRRKADLHLEPLLEAYREANRGARLEEFVADLFATTGVYEVRMLPLSPTGGQRTFLYWRSVDEPARVRPFSAVRDKVVEAWRFEKARNLARRDADALVEKINKDRMAPADAERHLREQKEGGEIFELDNVALLVPPTREVQPRVRKEYMRYQVPERLSGVLPYPPDDLAQQLVSLERPGEAEVVADRPARTFYVAVLFNRDEPTLKAFNDLYKKTPKQDTLYNLFLVEWQQEYHRAVLEQLRREAGPVDKQGQFIIPEAIRRRESGRSEEE